MKLDESTEIIEIKMLNIKTGEEWILSEKHNRDQHFMKPFPLGNYHIQLRLGWDDIRNGEPTLDADIWIEGINEKKEFLKTKNKPWHHTKKKLIIRLGSMYINSNLMIWK